MKNTLHNFGIGVKCSWSRALRTSCKLPTDMLVHMVLKIIQNTFLKLTFDSFINRIILSISKCACCVATNLVLLLQNIY